MSCSPAGNGDVIRIAGRSVRWEAVLGPNDWIKTSRRFTLGDWPWMSVIYAMVEIDLDRGGCSHGFLWGVAGVGPARLSIEIEFINFKLRKNGCTLTSSQLSYQMRGGWQMEAQSGLARMLNEGILSDILVNAVGGSLRAHRAVLAARSPVFTGMFSHDLREATESTLDIPDMSIGACRAFMSYLYGDLRAEEFLAHRSELLRAGDKYDVVGLRRACEESMLNDVDKDSALEMLHTAHLYGLSMLKRNCLTLLKDFRKMYELREDFQEFMRTADPDLVAEVNANFQTDN
ncbi:BTB/POZ domain-containing protein [Dichanthelium oligosanthes]|uniref:BTB/POZ domain-containing protein n=1 Tax=Dichanthelium oligosanthes TaxID=888268 RepID=A0A1E5WJ22_9POAL|nr:BTB/POZ domain-containing protein [Dichanthelium oligosanthes]